MSETWTEYAVRWRLANGEWTSARDKSLDGARETAEALNRRRDCKAIVVGRTVTASDWLPVDTDGAK